MGEKLLSVIIPVYNVEKYLEKCVYSITNQTYQNLEIILVDDGSKDSSGQICDALASADKRIKVLHKKNEGQAKARNCGMDLAKGEYIAFLDSDDYIASTMYAELINVIETDDCDIAACGVQEVDEEGTLTGNNSFGAGVFFLNKEEVVEDLYKQTKVRFEVWNKVFRRDILQGVRFIEGQLYEEVAFCRMSYLKINKYAYLDKPLHFYLCKRAGNTNSYFSEKKLCIFNEFDKFIIDVEAMQMSERIAEKFEALKINFCISLTLAANKHQARKEVKKFLKETYSALKKKNKNNPYAPRRAMMIFSLSPRLYGFLLSARRKLKGD